MIREDLPNELFELIDNKSYDQLTLDERKMVEEYMTPEEYNDFGNIVSDFQQVDTTMSFDTEPPQYPKASTSTLSNLMNSNIAAYKVLLGCLGLAFLLGVVFLNKDRLLCTPCEDQQVEYANQEKLGTSIGEDDYPEALVVQF